MYKGLIASVILAHAVPAIAQQAEPITVIHAGTVLTDPGKEALGNASVVVRGRTIESVQPGFVDIPGAKVIDLREATVLPD